MITKLATFRGVTDRGDPLVQVFRQGSSVTKVAGNLMQPIQDWLGAYKSDSRKIAILVNALGASEFWGQNVNGDIFPESALIHDCRCHPGEQHPVDDFSGKVVPPYGYWTFLNAFPYVHHRNKDPTRAFGKVAVACWNPKMKRVELVVLIDRHLAMQHDAQHIVDRVDRGDYPDVSMGCRVPYDVCTCCGNKSKTRNDYCSCIKNIGMGKILDDGRQIGVVNTYPRFFDISFVFIGADKTAKMMCKLGSAGAPQSVLDAERVYNFEETPEGLIKAACGRKGGCSECPGKCKVAEPRIAGVSLEESDRILSGLRGAAAGAVQGHTPADAALKAARGAAKRIGLDKATRPASLKVKGVPKRMSQKREAQMAEKLLKKVSAEQSRFTAEVYSEGTGEPTQHKKLTKETEDGLSKTILRRFAPPPPSSQTVYGREDPQDDEGMRVLPTNENTPTDGVDDDTKLSSAVSHVLPHAVERVYHLRGHPETLENLDKQLLMMQAAGSWGASRGIRSSIDGDGHEWLKVKGAPGSLEKEKLKKEMDKSEVDVHSLKKEAKIVGEGGGTSSGEKTYLTEFRTGKRFKYGDDFIVEEMLPADSDIKRRKAYMLRSSKDGQLLAQTGTDDFGSYIRLAFQHTPKEHRRKGYGTSLLAAVGRLNPDKKFVAVPDPFMDRSASVEDLTKFYKESGFGVAGDYGDGRPLMVRASYNAARNYHKEKSAAFKMGPPPSPNRDKFPFVGTINFRGLLIYVENAPGTWRTGPGWKTLMKVPYGEFARSLGTDGDKLDVYVGPDRNCENVFIVHQNFVRGPKKGEYDEDKTLLGFSSPKDAKSAYLAHYDSPDFFGCMSMMPFSEFKRRLDRSKGGYVEHSEYSHPFEPSADRLHGNPELARDFVNSMFLFVEGRRLISVPKSALGARTVFTRGGKPPSGEYSEHRRGAYPELPRDLLDRKTLIPKNQRLLHRPKTRASVKTAVLGLSDYFQVVNGVVKPIPIAVVDNLGAAQLAPKYPLHDNPVLQALYTVNVNQPVLCVTPKGSGMRHESGHYITIVEGQEKKAAAHLEELAADTALGGLFQGEVDGEKVASRRGEIMAFYLARARGESPTPPGGVDRRGEVVSHYLEKTAESLRLEDLFDSATTENSVRRERTWRDKTTNKETNVTGSGMGSWEKTKTASVKVCSPMDLYKLSTEDKEAAKRKWAEIIKEVGPSKAVGQTSPLLSDSEPSIPREALDAMGAKGLESALATPSLMGMVLKPKEFQRISLVHMGKKDLADQLDDAGACFRPRMGEEGPCTSLEPHHADMDLLKMLLPLLSQRSYFGPVVRRRIIRITMVKPKPQVPEQEVDSPLLSKVASAYNWYRREQMKVATDSLDRVTAIPELHAAIYGLEDADLFKTAGLPDRTTMGMMLGAIPLTLMYSAHLRSEQEQGRDVGTIGRFVADHPWLTSMAAVSGTRALMETPAVRQHIDEGIDRAARAGQALRGH